METHSGKLKWLHFACAILLASTLYLLLLDFWGLSLFGSVIDYTRFGTWSNAISGIGTSIAIIVALASLLSQRSNARDIESRRILVEETSVFQWLTSKEVRDINGDLVGRIWDLRVQNATTSPVYEWKVIFSSDFPHLCSTLKRPLIPGDNIFNLPFLDDLEPSRAPEATLLFESRSGNTWSRSGRGLLSQVEAISLSCEHIASPISPDSNSVGRT